MSLKAEIRSAREVRAAQTRAGILDFEPNEPLSQSVETALDCLGMSLERRLTPAIAILLVRDLDKKPPWGHAKVFDIPDPWHNGKR